MNTALPRHRRRSLLLPLWAGVLLWGLPAAVSGEGPLAGHAIQSARRWQVLLTANFRILHFSEPLARRVGPQAERVRAAQMAAWGNLESPPPWRPRCDLLLYPTGQELLAMTGRSPKAGSAITRPSRLSPGLILSRRVNLAADDPHLLDWSLPHEVTHVVLADLLAGKIPAWANEGMATLVEGQGKHRLLDLLLVRALVRGRSFALEELMALTTYPQKQVVHLFYAQSASLVRFFVSQLSCSHFVEFLRFAKEHGYEMALHIYYGLSGYQELTRSWLGWIKARLRTRTRRPGGARADRPRSRPAR